MPPAGLFLALSSFLKYVLLHVKSVHFNHVFSSMACRCISRTASPSNELFFNGVLLRVEKQFRERICFSIACVYMSRAAMSSTELFFNGVSVHVKCHCTSKAATSSMELFFKGMPLHCKNGHFEHVVVFQLLARVISRMKLTKNAFKHICLSICKRTC